MNGAKAAEGQKQKYRQGKFNTGTNPKGGRRCQRVAQYRLDRRPSQGQTGSADKGHRDTGQGAEMKQDLVEIGFVGMKQHIHPGAVLQERPKVVDQDGNGTDRKDKAQDRRAAMEKAVHVTIDGACHCRDRFTGLLAAHLTGPLSILSARSRAKRKADGMPP